MSRPGGGQGGAGREDGPAGPGGGEARGKSGRLRRVVIDLLPRQRSVLIRALEGPVSSAEHCRLAMLRKLTELGLFSESEGCFTLTDLGRERAQAIALRGKERFVDDHDGLSCLNVPFDPSTDALVRLSRGWVAVVSRDDLERLPKRSWSVDDARTSVVYARCMIKENGAWKSRLMHRLIMGQVAGHIDHIHHYDKEAKIIDNRRSNLRVSTPGQNVANNRKAKGKSSIFKGVCFPSGQSLFMASAGKKYLGLFKEEAHAALVYDLWAVKTYGEFARTNFPIPGSERWIFG